MAGPQLLEKRTINAEVATQKKQQIDEGLRIASKVDAVRETLGAEEANLENFRRQTIARVQSEIDGKIGERNALENVLIPMRKERERLLIPPDLTNAREEIKNKTANLEQDISEVNQKKAELEQGISLNIQRERENEIETERIAELKRLALLDRENSYLVLKESKSSSHKMLTEAQKILQENENKEKELNNRGIQLDAREKTLIENETINAIKEKDLKNRERILKDRTDMLIRNENRLKK